MTKVEVGIRYLARQPILDARGRVSGYELLYRNAPTSGFAGDGEQATRTMLDNLVLYDLHRFTGGEAAFINCTEETLTSGLVSVAPPETTVLEVLETVEPTTALVRSCTELKSLGYRIALDDFQWRAGMEPLVELADYIKIDFLQSGPEERSELVQRLRGRQAVLVAEKIETQAEFQQAVAEGFELYQGYYFCRPELIGNRVIPANLLAQVELMLVLKGEEMDFREISRLVQRDPSITYRLLRMVNSAAFGMRWRVRSVEMAMIAVGEGMFRRVAMLAIAAALCPRRSWEVLRMALVRARFCELSAAMAGYDSGEQYLLGLFSMLPAMLHIPMEEAVAKVSLRGEIREALMGSRNEEGLFLGWMELHERCGWRECDEIADRKGLDRGHLSRNVHEALAWADGMLEPIGPGEPGGS